MGLLTTIEVREVASGWRVQQGDRVIVAPTSQDQAMIAALDEASSAFESGKRAQVVVAPIYASALQP